MFIGQLVESWGNGFGRIIKILPMGQVLVKWSWKHCAGYTLFESGIAKECLKFYNADESNYVEVK